MKNKQMDYLPLWSRYLEMFRQTGLSKAQVGELIYGMMEYQFEGQEPSFRNRDVKVVWMFIREDLNRIKLRYDQAVEHGKKGGRPRKKPKETENNREKPITESESKTESKSKSESTSKTETSSPEAAGDGGDLSVCKTAYGEFRWVLLSKDQYRELEATMGSQELQACIDYIDRSAQSTNNRNQWQDWALVLRRCYEGRWHEARRKPDSVPMGASGVLGDFELSAIHRLLRENIPEEDGPPDPTAVT